MKVYEFVNNDDKYITSIESLIFYDEKWCFPISTGAQEYIEILLGEKVSNEYIKLAEFIVSKLNEKNVKPNEFTYNFLEIIKELNDGINQLK